MKTSLTIEDIEAEIVSEQVARLGEKTTAVTLILRNGFECTGLSSCVDPAKYDAAIGAKVARQRALDIVWQVEGYLLQERLFEDTLS